MVTFILGLLGDGGISVLRRVLQTMTARCVQSCQRAYTVLEIAPQLTKLQPSSLSLLLLAWNPLAQSLWKAIVVKAALPPCITTTTVTSTVLQARSPFDRNVGWHACTHTPRSADLLRNCLAPAFWNSAIRKWQLKASSKWPPLVAIGLTNEPYIRIYYDSIPYIW